MIVIHKHPFLYFSKSRQLNRNLELQERQRQVRRSIESCSATFSSPEANFSKFSIPPLLSSHLGRPWPLFSPPATFVFISSAVMRAGFVKRYNNAATPGGLTHSRTALWSFPHNLVERSVTMGAYLILCNFLTHWTHMPRLLESTYRAARGLLTSKCLFACMGTEQHHSDPVRWDLQVNFSQSEACWFQELSFWANKSCCQWALID